MSLAELRRKSQHDLFKLKKDALIAAILDGADADSQGEDETSPTSTDLILLELRALKRSQQSSTDKMQGTLNAIQQKLVGVEEKMGNIEERLKDHEARINILESRPIHSAVPSVEQDFLVKSMAQHQRYLESLEAEKRSCNVIITGLSEDDCVIAEQTISDDKSKVQELINLLQAEASPVEVMRLGNDRARTPRAIKVEFNSKTQRDNLLSKSSALNDMLPPLNKIYIKKDVHPRIRKEHKRLKEVVKAEKYKPENASLNVRYDYDSRVVMVGDTVVDGFTPNFF